jgi:hypothetical protein
MKERQNKSEYNIIEILNKTDLKLVGLSVVLVTVAFNCTGILPEYVTGGIFALGMGIGVIAGGEAVERIWKNR